MYKIIFPICTNFYIWIQTNRQEIEWKNEWFLEIRHLLSKKRELWKVNSIKQH